MSKTQVDTTTVSITSTATPGREADSERALADPLIATLATATPTLYRLSGSGCRAATTPPRAAAERLAQIAQFTGILGAAGHGATRRSATSSTTPNRYPTLVGERLPSIVQ